MPRCVVPGCHRRNTSTHFFPSDPARRQQWINFVRSIDPDFPTPGQYSSICGAHFETRFYNFSLWIDKEENSFGSKNPRRTLSEGAVPTIVGDESASSLSSLMQFSTPANISMIHGLPTSTITKNGTPTKTTAETQAETLPATSTIANTVKSNISGRNYTVMKNRTGHKVCIFRPLAQKTASMTTPREPIVSLSIATTKAATITTASSTQQPVSPVIKISAPNLGQSQQIIMLQDGAPVKLLKTNSTPRNLENNRKQLLKQTIIHRQPVKLTTVQAPKSTPNTVQIPRSTIPHKASTEEVIIAPTKKLFTVDELDKLSQSDFLNKFTSKVKIMDSRNFAMRCQLIKSCPFIISCPSESDCHDVMFLHLKKHIATLRARQEGNKVPYKISTGVKLSSTSVNTQQPETIIQGTMNGLSTVLGGMGSVAIRQNILHNGGVVTSLNPNLKQGTGSVATGQNLLQNGGVVTNVNPASMNIKQSFMKVIPVSKVQINPPSSNRTMTTTQSTPNLGTVISSIPVVNQTVKGPVVLDPRNLPIKNIGSTGQQMMVQVGKQLKVVQGAGSSIGSGPSSNMTTFLLVPFNKPAPHAAPVKGRSSTSSVPKNQSANKKASGFPNILRPPANQNTLFLPNMNLTPATSLKSNASPLDITNEMILKAKAVLDKRTANQSKIPGLLVNDKSSSLPPFQLKITPPRLYDLAKHAIMNGDAWDLKLAKLLSHIHSRKPLSKKEMKLGVYARGESNPGTSCSTFGVYMARKNEFLSSLLCLERVGSKKLQERCKQRDARTRLQRKKLQKQLKKSANHCKPRHLNHKNLHLNMISEGILQKKRSCKSLLWWREPAPKRIRFEMVDQPKEVKYKPNRKLHSFWYVIPESSKKSSRKAEADKPLKEILQSGLIVLKRSATKLPQREIISPKKAKNCEEVTIGGKVIKIKQEPVSDDDFNDPLDIDGVPDKLLQPPSDDDMDDLFPEDNMGSDIETTDSESEFCIANRKTHETDSPVISSVTSVPRSEFVEDEIDVPLRAIKYFQRLCEIIRVMRENNASGPILLPAALKKCKICSTEFERVDLLLHHYKQHASEIQKAPIKENAEDSSLQTSNKRQQNMNRKRNSFKKTNGIFQHEQPFKCELCQMRFYTCKTFEEHLIESHSHSTKAMAHVLFSQSSHSPQVTNSSIYDLVLPDLHVPNSSEDIPSTSRSVLNDLLIENENQIASDSLECHSPPLPRSPKSKVSSQPASNSSRPFNQTSKAVRPRGTVSIDEAATPDLQPIKLTLFPRNGSGLSRICFANNRRLLES